MIPTQSFESLVTRLFRDIRKGVTPLHAQRPRLVDAVGGDGFVSAGAGAEVCFGSGPLDRAEGGAASGRGDGTRWVDSAQRCGRHPGTRSPSSQSAFGEQIATGPESSAYTSRTALLTKRRAVRSTNHLVTKRA